MEFDWNVLMNYGAMGACLTYFIYKDNVTMKKLTDTVNSLEKVVAVLTERVSK